MVGPARPIRRPGLAGGQSGRANPAGRQRLVGVGGHRVRWRSPAAVRGRQGLCPHWSRPVPAIAAGGAFAWRPGDPRRHEPAAAGRRMRRGGGRRRMPRTRPRSVPGSRRMLPDPQTRRCADRGHCREHRSRSRSWHHPAEKTHPVPARHRAAPTTTGSSSTAAASSVPAPAMASPCASPVCAPVSWTFCFSCCAAGSRSNSSRWPGPACCSKASEPRPTPDFCRGPDSGCGTQTANLTLSNESGPTCHHRSR